MSISDQIVTTLLKHGPLHVHEIVDIIDIDEQRTYYDDCAGTKSMVATIVWKLLEQGVLIMRQDRTFAVVKKDFGCSVATCRSLWKYGNF